MTTTPRLGEATYDPADDKLRLRAFARLAPEDYARAKRFGFRWAPRQELFYAMWSPAAADLLHEWCGEIGDEETSLAERAEERADRFEDYSSKRERDGDNAHAAVSAIADNIPLGQPILVGHHSERRACKDAERIENGMRKAIRMWETAEYWQQRAAGAIAAANYKDRAGVRARRIKKLEADKRRRVAEYTPHGPEFIGRPWSSCAHTYSDHAQGIECDQCREQPLVMVGNKGRGAHPVRVASLPAREEAQRRWIEHLDRRLAYERALLEQQGATDLLKPKARPKAPPILNYKSEQPIPTQNRYRAGVVEPMEQVSMTKAAYAKIASDYKGTRLHADGSHRLRMCMEHSLPDRRGRHGLVLVFLTDSKAHPRPEGC